MALHTDDGAAIRRLTPVAAVLVLVLLTVFGAAVSAAVAVRSPADEVRLVVSAAGNEARYRIRERLAGRDLPNDAVGATSEVSGAIALNADGTVNAAASRISIAAASLQSDQNRRDNYVRRNTLATEQFPDITLAPTSFRGLTGPLPTSGSRSFELLGVLTVRDVARPAVWTVTAEFSATHVSGQATTAFTFADFQLQQPRVPIVLSVADTIRLEYDFRFEYAR